MQTVSSKFGRIHFYTTLIIATTGGILIRRVNRTADNNVEEDSACNLSSTGDKQLYSSATNDYSSSSDNRVNEINLRFNISKNSLLLTSSAAS